MKEQTTKIRSLTGIKNAILKHKKVWLTLDGKNWLYAVLKSDGYVIVNYGLTHETVTLHKAMGNIFDFLSFKKSTDLL